VSVEVATEGRTAQRFEALFAAHRVDVLRYVFRRVRPDVAEDVVSEVFLIAWRRQSEVPSNALPWLYGVARKVLANQRRSTDRRTGLALRAAAQGPAVHDGRAADPESAVVSSLAFAAAVSRLSDDDREVISLVAWEGLSARDIGVVLGCSAPAVAMRLQRARRRLRAHLQAEQEGN
jgi:RNA polymerase sigma factor (sigma-70 family)